jgi:hypothetical protein
MTCPISIRWQKTPLGCHDHIVDILYLKRSMRKYTKKKKKKKVYGFFFFFFFFFGWVFMGFFFFTIFMVGIV